MSWRDDYREASFKGAKFHVNSTEMEFGRRAVMHTYPFRDDATGEDLGRQPRTHTIDAYFIGNDYPAERDAFIKVAESAGPGLLIHPLLGERTCRLQAGSRLQWSRTELNYEALSLTFMEEGKENGPAPTPFLGGLLAEKADAVDLALAADIPLRYAVKGPSFIAQAAAATTTIQAGTLQTVIARAGAGVATLAPWLNRLSLFQAGVAGLISNPVQYIASSLNLLGGVGPLFPTALRAYGVFQRLYALLPKPTWDYSPTEAPARVQLNTNRALQATVWRVNTVTQIARQASAIPFTSRDQAIAVRDTVAGQIRQELLSLGQTDLDETAAALRSLQSAVVQDLTEQAGRLERYRTVRLLVPTPALVLAFDLYDDISREAELVAENRVTHPGFVAPGRDLRVLSG